MKTGTAYFSEPTYNDQINIYEVVLFQRRNSGTEIGRLDKLFTDYEEADKALKKLVTGKAFNYGVVRITKRTGEVTYLGIFFDNGSNNNLSNLSVQDVVGTFIGDRILGIIQPLMEESIRLTKEVLEGNYE